MKNTSVVVKVNNEVYKMDGYNNFYIVKNPFGAWSIIDDNKIIADNLSLEEAKKKAVQIKISKC